MSHAHVVEVLPKLRRHAFILFGDRTLADDSVSQCLKAYKRAPGSIRPGSASLDMFRLFHDVVAAPARRATHTIPTTANRHASESDGCAPLRDLGRLSAAERQVYGLVAVERLTVDEAAQVLGQPPAEVRHLLMRAHRALTMESLAPTGTDGR